MANFKKTVMLMDEEKKKKLKIMVLDDSVPESHLYMLVDRVLGEFLDNQESTKEREKKRNKVAPKRRRRKR